VAPWGLRSSADRALRTGLVAVTGVVLPAAEEDDAEVNVAARVAAWRADGDTASDIRPSVLTQQVPLPAAAPGHARRATAAAADCNGRGTLEPGPVRGRADVGLGRPHVLTWCACVFLSVSACAQPAACVCEPGYEGSDCGTPSAVTCAFRLLAPAVDCDNAGVCPVFPATQPLLTLTYRVDCRFVQGLSSNTTFADYVTSTVPVRAHIHTHGGTHALAHTVRCPCTHKHTYIHAYMCLYVRLSVRMGPLAAAGGDAADARVQLPGVQ
jgi:hypothetical protein